MVTSLKNIKGQVDSRLAGGGLSALACCQLQNAQFILDNNVVTSVANTASLPSNTLNEGRFVYVEDIKEYRHANDASWTDDVNSGICVYQTQIWGWGTNASGQLGDGTVTTRCSPIRELCSSTDWCQVSTGCNSTLAIKTTGELWAWGAGTCGMLGTGITAFRCSPVREFCSATDWCQVSAACRHAIALKTSGQIWSWGLNYSGRLGDGTTLAKCSPVRERSSSTDWCQVSTSPVHAVAVKTSGQIWSWGTSSGGRLGDGSSVDRCSPVREFCSATDWCQASAGFSHSSAVKTSGELWAWGNNIFGNIGDGTTVNRCSPVREFCSATDWCQVGTGYQHTAAVKTSGELWAWGNGSSGRIGDGNATTRCSPVREFCSATDWCQVSAASSHTSAIKTSGQLWAWGAGSCGRLGDGTLTGSYSPVREFYRNTDWCQVSAQGYNTIAIRAVTKGFLE